MLKDSKPDSRFATETLNQSQQRALRAASAAGLSIPRPCNEGLAVAARALLLASGLGESERSLARIGKRRKDLPTCRSQCVLVAEPRISGGALALPAIAALGPSWSCKRLIAFRLSQTRFGLNWVSSLEPGGRVDQSTTPQGTPLDKRRESEFVQTDDDCGRPSPRSAAERPWSPPVIMRRQTSYDDARIASDFC